MDPLKIFKIPLDFLGSSMFLVNFKKLNKNCSTEIVKIESIIKYKIDFKFISPTQVEIIISLQDDPSIVIYKFVDKLITVPKMEEHEILIERTIMSRKNEVYLIDLQINEILLIKKGNINYKPKGYIKTIPSNNKFNRDNLKKIITFYIEA
uniref:Uncharacterized protein n=1 Tax=Amanita basii TaxID=1262671 RepID=A0A5Q0N201_9AGAR|nr:hypothetical protein [Amanita basii]QFZ98535.1 hypothetical protein [Amanita basii]